MDLNMHFIIQFNLIYTSVLLFYKIIKLNYSFYFLYLFILSLELLDYYKGDTYISLLFIAA